MQDGSIEYAHLPVPTPQDPKLSHILRGLTAGEGERVFVGDLVDAFGHRAFGALLFAFSLLTLIAAVPGSSAVMAVPIILISAQLVVGAPNLWLPRAIDRRSMRKADLARLLDKALPPLERVERFLAPRLGFMFGPLGDRLIGLGCLLLAVVLALPIPFFNFLPGTAIAGLSLGLAVRDGIVALIGYGIAAACVVVLVLSANVVIAALERMMHLFGV